MDSFQQLQVTPEERDYYEENKYIRHYLGALTFASKASRIACWPAKKKNVWAVVWTN